MVELKLTKVQLENLKRVLNASPDIIGVLELREIVDAVNCNDEHLGPFLKTPEGRDQCSFCGQILEKQESYLVEAVKEQMLWNEIMRRRGEMERLFGRSEGGSDE